VHLNKQASIRKVLDDLRDGKHKYDNLDWRLDIQVIGTANLCDVSASVVADSESMPPEHSRTIFHDAARYE
jgi:hypothetical protein